MSGAVYIYGLLCPLTNAVRYVGKTNAPVRRYKEHVAQTWEFNGARKDGSPSDKQLWMQELAQQDLHPRLVILEELDWDGFGYRDYGPNRERENHWIRKLSGEGHPLTNALPDEAAKEQRLLEDAIDLGRQMFG